MIAEAPDLVRVRRLLCELRPDASGPLGWGPDETGPSPPALQEAPRASGGRPYPSASPSPDPAAAQLAWARVQVLRAQDPEAGEALAWLQTRGTLAAGLGALYRALGAHAQTPADLARWTSPRAHLDGQRALGSRLARRACDAWWKNS